MIDRILSRVARVRFTVGYVAILAAVSFAILSVGPHTRELVIQHASTNLHNLAHGRLGTLLGSAFVVDAGPVYFWMPFLTCLLVLAELHLRSIRLMVAFVIGHIGATLVVVGALAGAVEFGWLPRSITRASDVGMSYGALAVLGALTAAIPRRWRPAWVGWWVFAAMAAAVVGGDFTDAGHTVAVILGVLVSAQFRGPIHWTPVRLLMLVGSSGFGFLLLAHHWASMAAAPVFGLIGALAVHHLVRLTRARTTPSTPTVVAAQPVLAG
jgi:hypothetical protein